MLLVDHLYVLTPSMTSSSQDPLLTALCPTVSCTGVSHLSCLSRYFLDTEPSSSNSDIIPRGGNCKSCHSYILWGDIIRGCYRRRDGGVTPDAELEDADDRVEDLGQLFGADIEDDAAQPFPKAVKPSAAARAPKKRPRAPAPAGPSRAAPYTTMVTHASSDEREHFDLDAISGVPDDAQDSDDGRPQWHPALHAKASSRPVSSQPLPTYPRVGTKDGGRPSMDAPGSPVRLVPDEGGRVRQDGSHSPMDVLAGQRDERPELVTAGAGGGTRFVFTSADCFMFSS